ncbi:MAG TPA: bifunctional pyr operon transcriptional regulator/uracil phosphoribosyltransferase PyrR [Verrucomicrobiota bacterium]|nr:bifunctional pyr operon transcriptional regulator/uracil phosphoribosyltransferase PyrR [Verrucomicrobiales bacterium]HRI11387.1 bifunctional pyr operon transcriptional regulator/uracil phosphoribosyltransferase PyrR [Verrucomicrobiota bacterium]
MNGLLLDATGLTRAIARMAHEIAERNPQTSELAMVGIQKGGITLSRRLASVLERICNHAVPLGVLDVSMYRDDLNVRAAPDIQPTQVPFDVAGRTIVLVDDVLFTGRTVRAALDALHDLGRPRRVQLAVLVDRGHRELPIRADFVGKNVPTSNTQWIKVRLTEGQSNDAVELEEVPR